MILEPARLVLLALVMVATLLAACAGQEVSGPATDDGPRLLGSGRWRHAGLIRSLAFSPDGRALLTGSRDGSVRLWEADSGAERRRWEAVGPLGASVAVHPDGARIAFADGSGDVRVHSLADGARRATFTPKTGPATCVVFSPDGLHAASAQSDGTIHLWEIAAGRVEQALEGSGSPATSLAFVPRGAELVSAHLDGTLRVWSLATGRVRRTLAGSRRGVTSVAVSPDGRRLAAVSGDFEHHEGVLVTVTSGEQTVSVWEQGKDAPSIVIEAPDVRFSNVRFSPDGALLAYGGRALRIYSLAERKVVLERRDPFAEITAVDFHPAGAVVATGSSTVRLWNLGDGTERTRLDGHDLEVTSLVFEPGTSRILTAGADGRILRWAGSEAAAVDVRFHAQDRAAAVACSADGRLLIVGSSTGAVTLHPADGGPAVWRGREGGGEIRGLILSSDGERAAWCAGQVGLLELASRTQSWAPLDGDAPAAVALAAKGSRAWAGGGSGRLWTLDLAAGTAGSHPAVRGAMTSVSVAPDERLALCSSVADGTVLLDRTGRAVLERWAGARSLLSPDGKLAAVGHRRIVLIEVATRQPVSEIADRGVGASVLTFAPDGRALGAGYEDGTAVVRPLPGTRDAEASRLAPEQLCARLDGRDAAAAYGALWELSGRGQTAVEALRKALREPSPADPRLEACVAALEGGDLAQREAAAVELLALDSEARLWALRAGASSPEVRERAAAILDRLAVAPVSAPGLLRRLRAIQALEYGGTADGRRALEEAGAAAPEIRVGREARAAVERLGKRRL